MIRNMYILAHVKAIMSFALLLLQSPLLWVAVLLAVVYWSYLPCHRFRKTGIKYLTPLPLLGEMTRVLFYKQSLFHNPERLYADFPGERFVGMSETIRPVVVIRDLELARRISVTDFEHFQRHSIVIDDKVDSVFGKFILALEGQKWKLARSRVGPFFSSLKLCKMITLLVKVGDCMVGSIRRRLQESKSNYWDTDVKTICSHASFDVFVSCALGLRLDSRDHSNATLYEVGTNLFGFRRRQILLFLGYQDLPFLMKVIGPTMFSQKHVDVFKKLFIETLSMRKDENIKEHDFIDIILQAENELSDDDWFTQALSLCVAGFDSVTTATSMLVHELALNPEVQERLAQEIQETDRRTGGKIDYTTIQEMTYMDMVVSESLRMWSNIPMERMCTKDYNLGRPNDSATEDYIIRKGEGLVFPMRGVHYDPQYFSEPTKFDPERFSKENRHKIPAYAYNPFGMGPRVCIGIKFAVCVIKVLTYQLLRDVEVSRCEETSSPRMRTKEGQWVRLGLRE